MERNRINNARAGEGEKVDHIVVADAGGFDVLRGGGFANHVGMRVVFFDNLLNFIGGPERKIAFPFGPEINHHPRVPAPLQIVPLVFRDDVGRDAFRQRVCKRGHAFHIAEAFQLIRKLLLFYHGGVRVQDHQQVAAPELRVDRLVVRIQPRAGAGAHRFTAVDEAVHSLRNIGRRRDKRDENQHGIARFERRAAQLLKLWQKRPVGRLFNQLVAVQNQRGHQEQHGGHADDDSLCEDDAKVEADGEFHRRQHQKAHDGTGAAGNDGVHGLVQRVADRLVRLLAGFFFADESVKQKNGEIHRAGQQQNGCDVCGQKRNPPQKNIGSAVDDDDDGHDEQEQERLEPRVRRKDQDQTNQHEGQYQNTAHFAFQTFADGFLLYRGTDQMSFRPDCFFDTVKRL